MFCIARFKDIEKREYDCEVVTPLFLGGANPREAELRVPSIKGALRFWWRALYGENDIKQMMERETAIFGSTKQKSTVTIQVLSKELRLSQEKLDKGYFNIYEYLAYGYRKGEDIKGYIIDGRFKVQLQFKSGDQDQIMNSFAFLTFYGGLGAKSRNGFGSLHCNELQKPEFRRFNKGKLKKFTSFSEQALLFESFNEKPSWKEALEEVGNAFKDGRYELKSSHMDRSLIAKPFAHDHSRHAKPYFLHINKISDRKYKGQILYLPYEYYDEGRRPNYFRVCQKLNKSLEQHLEGVK
jgi:CRISPR-associated protein Cmr1